MGRMKEYSDSEGSRWDNLSDEFKRAAVAQKIDRDRRNALKQGNLQEYFSKSREGGYAIEQEIINAYPSEYSTFLDGLGNQSDIVISPSKLETSLDENPLKKIVNSLSQDEIWEGSTKDILLAQ